MSSGVRGDGDETVRGDGQEGKDDSDEETDAIDVERCSPAREHTLDIDNRYFPLPIGRQLTLEGDEEGTAVRVRVSVLDRTEMVGDVATRVVEEREWEDGTLVEASRNYFAQTRAGTVCYFGEAVDIYENGEIVSHEGAWRADEAGKAPGIIMPAEPEVGARYQQEVASGVAEDVGMIIARGETVDVSAGTFEDTLRTYE